MHRHLPRITLIELLTSADDQAPAPERHLWLVRLLGWLQQPGPPSAYAPGDLPDPTERLPWPTRKLIHLLNVLDERPEDRQRITLLLRSIFGRLDATGLLADYGFPPRQGFVSELGERLRLICLPGTPQTHDLGELFHLLFRHPRDFSWLHTLDTLTVRRLLQLYTGTTATEHDSPASEPPPWQPALVESIQLLASQLRAAGLSAAMRQRMSMRLLVDRPFHRIVQAAETLRDVPHTLQAVHTLQDVLDACCTAADSVRNHLDEHGISVDLVFQIEQIHARAERIRALLICLAAPDPAEGVQPLLLHLVQAGAERHGITPLFSRHYSLLARKVTERSAETGAHYITRTLDEYRAMLRQAAGGGAIIGLTTLMKFAISALSLSVFWAGFWAGINYAASFVLVQLLHFTVATKQPAMTAPTLAAKLEHISASDSAVEDFVDEVAHLLRSQIAGILGNLVMVVPVVLLIQGWSQATLGSPLIGASSATYVLHSLHLQGPTVLYAAFTGVLLFASSLIAGWVENWFVFHRLDSAIAWNPRFLSTLGTQRAQYWAHWWRNHISGIAANVSLGLLLGIVPALGTFFGLPLEVRHVTLAAGQLAAALGSLGADVLHEPDFWWCVAAVPCIGLLNVGVSFYLAFRVALASRGLRVQDRGRLYTAMRQRWRSQPATFFFPPRH